MSDPGWADITSTNAMLGLVLDGLGYKQKVDTLAVPVTFEALKNGQLDVFLGNWMPAQDRFVKPLTPMPAAGAFGQSRRHPLHPRGAGLCGQRRRSRISPTSPQRG